MRIATFNAASVRARLPILLEWLATEEPDVLAIQETKVEDSKFPFQEFQDLGYQVEVNGQKAWNGVAMLTKMPAIDVRRGFLDDLFPNDARILTCKIGEVSIINTYVPHGNTVGSEKWDYKMRWLERFRKFLDQNFLPTDKLIWLGDINVAPTPLDVYDSKKTLGGVGHHPDEFSRLETILEFGLVDVFRLFDTGGGQFTFWDFTVPNGFKRNIGWRIDHIYATPVVADLAIRCWIDKEPRSMQRPSDHTFVIAEFNSI